MNFRTDLAIENKEMYHQGSEEDIEISGVEVETSEMGTDISITKIKITDENGSRALSKPIGNYVTLEVKGILHGQDAQREELKQKTAKALAKELKEMIQFHYHLKVLVIGL
ncbi:MAG: GPR endopeptidase, partial [Anaerovorax sp.]